MDERSDTELLLASRAEPVAFVELYRRHAEDLLRYFARRTLDPEAAAELMSETFAEAYASRGNYRDTGANGVAWLYGIAQHQLSRFFRTGRLSAMARGRVGINHEELPADDYERIEELVDLGGGDALALMRAYLRIEGSTAEVAPQPFAYVISVRDGRIVRVRDYPDRAEAWRAVGREPGGCGYPAAADVPESREARYSAFPRSAGL